MENLKTTEILGVRVTSDSEDNILKYILENIETRTKRFKVFTPNPEILMFAKKHPEFKAVLNEANVNLPDGIGLLEAAKLLGASLKSRITGTDFMERLCKVVSEENFSRKRSKKRLISIGFFGGRANVAKTTSECLQKKYSGLEVFYADSEWNQAKLQGKHIDILFVAMGFPKQEKWISENLEKIPVTMAMGVGGAFDFLGGFVPRAPKFLRTLGLEWLFRLIIQPWRIKRQLQLIPFVFLVLGEFLKLRIFGEKA